MPPRHRIVEFEGASNFRDIGGLITGNGNFMKQGIVYRSDSLHRISKSDADTIENLNIKLICDLRTPNERKGKIDKLSGESKAKIESIPIYPMPSRQDPGALARMILFITGEYKKIDFTSFMKEYYQRIALEHPGEIQKIMTLLSNVDHLPAIIHCTAGKDRTGWISALLQWLAAVPKEMIIEDYLYTNISLGKNSEQLNRYAKGFSFFQIDPRCLRPIMEARREYLENAFTCVLQKYASIEDYLTKACAVAADTLLRLKTILRGIP